MPPLPPRLSCGRIKDRQMKNNALLWLWLKICTRDRTHDEYKLYKHFGSVEKIYSLTTDEIGDIDFLDSKIKIALDNKTLKPAELIKRNCDSNNIEIITIDDERYPESLLEINNSPCVLFALGNFEKAFSKPRITMVGTRECSSYGIRSATRISAVTAYAGFSIVTGVADGIDTAVITGALSVGGSVIAVLPTGHAGIPLGSSYKFKDVRKDGVILSEHLPDFKSHQFIYQQRNRILAGLGISTAVFQAPIQSGAIMTSNYTLNQNKEVFSLPANIDMPQSLGSNQLIDDGAIPILNYKTIVDYYKSEYKDVINDDIPEHLLQLPTINESSEEETYEFSRVALKYLDEYELGVFKAIQKGAIDADRIVEATQFSIGHVTYALSSLVDNNMIVSLPGNKYKIKI